MSQTETSDDAIETLRRIFDKDQDEVTRKISGRSGFKVKTSSLSPSARTALSVCGFELGWIHTHSRAVDDDDRDDDSESWLSIEVSEK